MRVFIAVIVLIFSFQSWTRADDIREFEIEGMSIGDSLLDYFDESEINNNSFTPWKDKKTFYQFGKKGNFKTYEAITISYLMNDKKFIIYELTGRNKMEYNKCKKKIREIALEIETLFESANKDDRGEYSHRIDKSKKSKVTSLNYHLNDGSIIHLGCYDWSNEITKKNGWTDKLTIALGSKKFREWQKNKAYK